MKQSITRILTTHAGSLPRPDKLIEMNRNKFAGKNYDAGEHSRLLDHSVHEIVRRQKDLGIDSVNDGEFGKESRGAIDYGAWTTYAWGRLSGWELQGQGGLPAIDGRRDRTMFAEFYRELDASHGMRAPNATPVFTGAIRYTGQAAVADDLARFKAALAESGAEEGFITSVAPGSFARRQNRHYARDEDFLVALAEALSEEYKAIIDAGFVLQLDDPSLPDSWDMENPEPALDEYRKFATLRVEALNHALNGLPEERIRYHICWGSWHGPHVTDLPLKNIIDLVLRVRAGAYSIEAANSRHEHEWKLWGDVKLPQGRLLVPGVVGHATNVVEHPELVADRIVRFASVVGRENVIAGTDCGLGGRVHPQIAWAKLGVLAEGAALATKILF